MRHFRLALSFLLVVFGAQSVIAGTYYVGSCKAKDFASIQSAVNAVPAGSIIDVCPGTYAEQVTIFKSLTLQGVTFDNSSQVTIVMPSSGLTTTSSLTERTIAAQIEVTAGPVNITGIAVDGSASNSNCPTVQQFAIFYGSGSSGTVNGVEAIDQNCFIGSGILVENGAGASKTVTIENSNFLSYASVGIYANNEQSPPTLRVSIKNNSLSGPFGIFFSSTVVADVSGNSFSSDLTGGNTGMFAGSPSGSVTNNFLTMPGEGDAGIIVGAAAVISGNTVNAVASGVSGIIVGAPATISGNRVINAAYGITLDSGAAGAKVTSNHILNSSTDGIDVKTGGTTIENNIITQSISAGIELNCNGGLNGGGTVVGNTINGAGIGIDQVPPQLNGMNRIYNAATATTTGCI